MPGGFCMCMMLYIASNKELPLVKWNEKNHILVEELDEHKTLVKAQFTKPYVYCVGSYQGCGCGFAYGYVNFTELKQIETSLNVLDMAYEEEKKRKSSVSELFEYIKQNLENDCEIELYSCWAGKEDGIPEQNLDINLSGFTLGDSFRFEENQFIKVAL